MPESLPRRIQRRRTKGWRAPEGAVYVGRGSRFGNPFKVVSNADGWFVLNADGGIIASSRWAEDVRGSAASWYRSWLAGPAQAELRTAVGRDLKGRDLMCWCPLPEPGQPDHCHAAVLLRLANAAAPAAGEGR